MKRSSPLRVEVLEDRCVPAADPLTSVGAPAPPISYVIDPILIDPSVPPAPPPASTPPATGTPPPLGIIPPIAPPIWF